MQAFLCTNLLLYNYYEIPQTLKKSHSYNVIYNLLPYPLFTIFMQSGVQ